MTDVYPYPVCDLCERHLRNGLVHYRPSNGTEGEMFFDQCYRCRHCKDDPNDPKPPKLEVPYQLCAYGVMDRVMEQMWAPHDHIANWFDPADLSREDAKGDLICPARCLRFTDKNDPDGARRDPPKPDCEGQMFFDELLTVCEVVPVTVNGQMLAKGAVAQ